ncbi:hypothetical protein ACFV94_29685 [Streptomyces sp. NPDC059896]
MCGTGRIAAVLRVLRLGGHPVLSGIHPGRGVPVEIVWHFQLTGP